MIMSMPEGFEEEAYKEKLAVISGKFSSMSRSLVFAQAPEM